MCKYVAVRILKFTVKNESEINHRRVNMSRHECSVSCQAGKSMSNKQKNKNKIKLLTGIDECVRLK